MHSLDEWQCGIYQETMLKIKVDEVERYDEQLRTVFWQICITIAV